MEKRRQKKSKSKAGGGVTATASASGAVREWPKRGGSLTMSLTQAVVAVIVVVLLVVASQWQWQGDSASGGVSERVSSSTTKNNRGSEGVAQRGTKVTPSLTYDGYVSLASEKQWSPRCPLHKLSTVVTSYNQLFELEHTQPHAHSDEDTDTDTVTASLTHTDTDSAQLVQMVEKEFQFVLNVLLNSRDHNSRHLAEKYHHIDTDTDTDGWFIDLTPVVFEAIEGVHRGIVRAGKKLLQNNTSMSSSGSSSVGAVVTRQQAEAVSMKYQYSLVFALLRLVRQVSTPSALSKPSTTSPEPAFPHIFIDIERKLGRYNSGVLGGAVSLGLYRLYEPLVMLGADCNEALLAAVRNADDLSLAMLLHLAFSQPRTGASVLSRGALINAMAVANSLKYHHLAARLDRALHPITNDGKRLPDVPFFNDFLSTQSPLKSTHLMGLEGGEKERIARGGDISCFSDADAEQGGYMQSRFSSRGGAGQCDIDILEAATLDVDEVVDRYFRLGRPVLIRGLLNGAIENGGWTLASLKNAGRSVKVTPSLIPYGDQLGGGQQGAHSSRRSKKKQKTVSLTDYVDTMREYSGKVQSWVESALEGSADADCYALNMVGGLNDSRTFLDEVQLPYYVFDNKILPSTVALESLATSPFPDVVGSISTSINKVTRHIDGGDGVNDIGFSTLGELIAAASNITYAPDGEVRESAPVSLLCYYLRYSSFRF